MHVDLAPFLDSWPAENVSAALIGTHTGTYGDAEGVYELASVTKLLSAYGILLAVEEGAFELDTPCGPESATVRHLLAHAGGVGFDTRELQKPVGERRIYSSAGYEILADFLEEETGIGFGEYLREGVFEPLGMRTAEVYGSAGHGGRASISDLALFAPVSYTHLTLPTILRSCRSRWSPYH